MVSKKPGLAAVGIATVAVLSESSSIERLFSLTMTRGHVLTIIAPFALHLQTVPWLLL